MSINEALSVLHAVQVAIDLHHQDKERVDWFTLSRRLMEARKTLERVRTQE